MKVVPFQPEHTSEILSWIKTEADVVQYAVGNSLRASDG
jgi:hypothetical protein